MKRRVLLYWITLAVFLFFIQYVTMLIAPELLTFRNGYIPTIKSIIQQSLLISGLVTVSASISIKLGLSRKG